ncbi:MnhB domain-containing protein [Rubrobacter indicoceani]|uniref:MnhB domain-containing protein n=1 Tax=Rubrobacter indicoceani TaxID=2051957 RepID=UPI001F08DACF|nr:MnhB domain-containing protein [Rubrobacter indicoceani]
MMNDAKGNETGMTVMTEVVARLLFAPSLVVALAVLIKGYADTGDGFNAGVIASLGILIQFVSFGYERASRLPLVRHIPTFGVAFGLTLALLPAFVPLFFGQNLFTHWPPPGAEVITFGTLEIITAVAFDVGVFLLVFGFGVGAINFVARATAEGVSADDSDRPEETL